MITSSSSAADLVAGGSSGGTCQVSGPYKCGTHTEIRAFFKSGQKFTNCPAAKSKNGHSATWSIVQEGTSTGGRTGGDEIGMVPVDSIT